MNQSVTTTSAPSRDSDAAQAEIAVLGGLLLDQRLVARVREILATEMFQYPKHGWIFAAICALYDRGDPVDTVLLGQELIARDQLHKIGGAVALSNLTDAVAHTQNVEHYALRVRHDHFRRRMSLAAREVYEVGKAPVEDVREYLAGARAKIQSIANALDTAPRVVPIAQATAFALESSMTKETCIRTGFSELDLRYGGIPNCYIVVGGYPGSGKTTFVTNLIINAALNGTRVLFLSMEDSRDVTIWRMMARFSGINLQDFVRHDISKDVEKQRKATAACEKIYKLPIVIDDTAGRTTAQVRDAIARQHDEKPLGMIVLDHMGKVHERGKDRYHQLSSISLALAEIQKQYDVPLIVISQLSRPEKESGNRPATVRQLRDSGNIEADARCIIMLHRPHYLWEIGVLKRDDPEPDPHELGVIVEKITLGPPDRWRMYVDLATAYVGEEPNEREYPATTFGGGDNY